MLTKLPIVGDCINGILLNFAGVLTDYFLGYNMRLRKSGFQTGCPMIKNLVLGGGKGTKETGYKQFNIVSNLSQTLMANVLYRSKISDSCADFRRLTDDMIKDLKLSAGGFDFEVDLFTQCATNSHIMVEVPIHYCRRT